MWKCFFGSHRWGPWKFSFHASTFYDFQHCDVYARECLECGTQQVRNDTWEDGQPVKQGKPITC